MLKRGLTVSIAIVALCTATLFFDDGKRAWQTHRLASAAATLSFRLQEGRSANLSHRPLQQLRGDGGHNPKLLGFLATVSELAQSSSDERLRGNALLLGGDTDGAIRHLRLAVRDESALAWSDLAAALVQRGTELDSAELLLDSVTAAQRAISIEPTLAAAHFNAGVAFDKLGLTVEAGRSFRRAEQLDEGTAWSEEAHRRAQTNAMDPRAQWVDAELRFRRDGDDGEAKKAIARDSASARRFAEGPYLVDWATATLAGQFEKAQQSLRLPRMVARELLATRGEKLLADAIEAIDRAESRGSALDLARGHLAYGEARRALQSRDAAIALAKFDEAAGSFDRAGSPMSLLAKYFAASALYNQARIEATLAKLDEVERQDPETKGYHALAAQLGWERGICLIVRGQYADALSVFTRSRTIASAVGDATLAAEFDGLASEALEYLGRSAEAWRARTRALRSFSALAVDQRKAMTLITAANLQLARRNWERCIVLLDQALPQALRLQDPVLATLVFAQRAIAHEELGHREMGASDRDRAALWLRRIGEKTVHARLAVEVEIAEGIGIRTESPHAAALRFTSAIDKFVAAGESAHLPRLYLERGRAYEAIGRRDEYRSDLMRGLAVIESWGKNIENLDQRSALNLWSETIIRDSVDLELRAGNVQAALANVERARSFDAGSDLASVPARLSYDAAIVEFALTRRGMVALVIRHNDARAVLLPASIESIAAAADSFRNSASDPSAAELYRLIIAPIRPFLDGVATLLVVPERELTGLPMGALFDTARQRFLIEDMAIVHASSSASAVRASLIPRSTMKRVLVIGANDFDDSAAVPLPSVEQEATSVARLWRGATLLLSTAATANSLRHELPRADLVHYAGHIVRHPSGSRLLLSNSALSVYDIARLPLAGTSVVVLAACRGSEVKTSYSMINDVASAFLVAGTTTVVASANDVDDAEAPRMMARLHTFLRDGIDVAEAVQRSAVFERQTVRGTPPSARLMVIGGSRRLVTTR